MAAPAASRTLPPDASIDRSLLLSTAQTIDDGDWSITSLDLVGLGVSWGARDNLELSCASIVAAPLFDVFLGVASVKLRAVAEDSVTLSAMAALEYANNVHGVHVVTPAALVLLDVHDSRGQVIWSTRLGLVQPFAVEGGEGGRSTSRPLWLLGSGIRFGITDNLAVLMDLMAGGGLGHAYMVGRPDVTVESLGLIAAGVRVFTSAASFSVDLAVGIPMARRAFPVPVIAGTWRF